jgi:uncharacterized membrane protein YphA (DoxX/SURF4 family)
LRLLGLLTVRADPFTGVPAWVAGILDARLTRWLARLALTLPFWWSGVDKLLQPHAAMVEITGMGLAAPGLVLVATIIVQLVGSLLIICNRYAWFGAGALAVFTALTNLIAHAFWNMSGSVRFAEMNTFMEHIALIAGFVFAAMAASVRSTNNHAMERRP